MFFDISKKCGAFLALTALVFAGSCSKVDEMALGDGPIGGNKMTVEAVWDDPAPHTKTVRQSDGKIFWSPGDAISLFYGDSQGSEFTATITEPSATASFEGYLHAATGSSEQGVVAQTFWGVYPYDAANTCDGAGVTLKVKDVQTSSPETFGKGMSPAVANSPGLSLSFKNVGSWFVFSVVSSGITSVKFSGNNGEDIAGNIYVTMDSSGKPVAQVMEGEGSKSITVTPEVGNEFIPNTDYYITLIPQTLSQGYTFTMYTADGQVAVRKLEVSKTFVTSQHLTGRKIDNGLTWQTMYVDMGDGVMWATMNVGASSPEEYGDYFAWGEASAKSQYDWSTYAYGTSLDALTKYNTTDTLTVLESGDDAATANWGGDWRTPTFEDWIWLQDNCAWEWTTEGGANGYKVTSNINGNSIFLPASGFKSGSSSRFAGSRGFYWSSSIVTSGSTMSLFFTSSGNNSFYNDDRAYGYSVRPVKGESAAARYVELAEGVRWATMNIGASSPEEYGSYFAWGETKTKTEYSNTNYEFGTTDHLTKYISNSAYGTVDNLTAMLPVDDAATAAWGGDWRTPTIDEWNWLTENCTFEETTENGVAGVRCTSTVAGYTDNSIFLPMAGFKINATEYGVGTRCYYWTASVYDTDVSYVARYGIPGSNGSDARFTGRPIRAIYKPRVAMESFSIYKESVTVGVDLKERLWTEYTPSDATEHGAVWTSSNEDVATVSGWGEVTGVSPGTATITATTLDGGFTASCTVTVIESHVDMGNGYEWATYNIGAESPEESGSYYAWGEINPKDTYSWDTYRFGTESSIRKYKTDALKYLQPSDDIATITFGADWHIPSKADWEWLIANCSWFWDSNYNGTGVSGWQVTSTITGGVIFLPDAGYYAPSYEDGTQPYTLVSQACYWSSDLSSDSNTEAQYLLNQYEVTTRPRCDGLPVRAVRRVAVDMGSGLKWATHNVGATTREYEYGDYYAWGDANTKNSYSWATYRWMQSEESDKYHITKYTVADGQTEGIWYDADGNFIGDGKTVVDLEDDTARLIWGGAWRTPTDDEWTWLRDNCLWTWTDNYQESGISGCIVKSNVSGFTDNTIFLPAAGLRGSTDLSGAGTYGEYWSSSLVTEFSEYGWYVDFSASNVGRYGTSRYYGYPVRPVSE